MADGQSYTVRAGDTLLGIALDHDLTWQALAEANNLSDDSFLQIGQELVVPELAAAASKAEIDVPAAPAQARSTLMINRVHTVRSGDTIFGIALQYDVDWDAIAAAPTG